MPAKERLLKHCDGDDFRILRDVWLESTTDPTPNTNCCPLSYLKYATSGQIQAMAESIPNRRIFVPFAASAITPNILAAALHDRKIFVDHYRQIVNRAVVAFPSEAVTTILSRCVDKPDKYLADLKGVHKDYRKAPYCLAPDCLLPACRCRASLCVDHLLKVIHYGCVRCNAGESVPTRRLNRRRPDYVGVLKRIMLCHGCDVALCAGHAYAHMHLCPSCAYNVYTGKRCLRCRMIAHECFCRAEKLCAMDELAPLLSR